MAEGHVHKFAQSSLHSMDRFLRVALWLITAALLRRARVRRSQSVRTEAGAGSEQCCRLISTHHVGEMHQPWVARERLWLILRENAQQALKVVRKSVGWNGGGCIVAAAPSFE